jgi:predicted metal-dependent hydrolase
MIVKYGTQEIEFTIDYSVKAKNSYITVERDSGVVVKAPESLNKEEIASLVRSKAKWIVSKLEEIGKENDFGEIMTGSRLYYLGKSYYVEVIYEECEEVHIFFVHSKFKIHAPKNVTQIVLKNAIDTFYKQKAEVKILKLVSKYSDLMKLFPEHIVFKKSKTKWGSCSERNRITFNPELVKLSSSLIEYAVVHELAHLKYKNHSKEFWKLIKKYMNNYLIQEDQLRTFEKKI